MCTPLYAQSKMFHFVMITCSYYYKMSIPGPCDASCKAGFINNLQTRLGDTKLPGGMTIDDVIQYRKAHKVC